MTDKKINNKTSNKNQTSEIHSSLLDLYNYLKVDKLQVVSKKKFINLQFYHNIVMSRKISSRDT
jgi:hypothetical protein